jgi:hypothetical protein
MVLARFVFSGSLDFKVELNRLKRTENIMQHDSTKIPEFGSCSSNNRYSLFALHYPEIKEVIGFIPYKVFAPITARPVQVPANVAPVIITGF